VFESKKSSNTPVVVNKEKAKSKGYYETIAYLWVLVLPIFIMCIVGGISLADIGFRSILFSHNIWFTIIVVVATFALFIYEFLIPMVSKRYIEQILKDEPEAIDEYPQTNKEKWLYTFQTLSSAVCEEIVYRGFFLFLLLIIFPGIPIILIIMIAFVTFGMGHLYQGLRGVVETGLFGALSMSLIIVTNSLLPSILLHFLSDFAPTFMIRKRTE
jgi:hypothetical protein